MKKMPERTYHRGYSFKLYPTREQADALRRHARMVASLWNALLERHETIRARTVQRQSWFDADGKRHVGQSVHCLTYEAVRYAHGERITVQPKDGKVRPWSCYDMQNEVTYLLNVDPEWRALSCWTGLCTAKALDQAFKAFYRRAREGAGAASGYPRFKRADKATSIPHRFASGCRLRPDEGRHKRAWAVTLKGVPGEIHAHGVLPDAEIEKFADADVTFRDGYWWLSAGCEMAPRRQSSRCRDIDIRWELIEGMVRINGVAQQIPGFAELVLDERVVDEMRREMDRNWPRNARLDETDREMRDEAMGEIRRLMASIRRRRANALHVWTCRIVREARAIHITLPRVQENTESGRGDDLLWGANVETIARLNREVLGQAPTMATAMLKYKAEEAGVPCVVDVETEPEIAVGRDLKKAGQTVRRAARQAKNEGKPQKRAA